MTYHCQGGAKFRAMPKSIAILDFLPIDIWYFYLVRADKEKDYRSKRVRSYHMAYFCRICESYLPNEKFSGKGRKIHVCKKCSQMPKEQRHHIEQKQEISDFLQQSNISDKNRSRLSTLSNSTDQEIAMLASIVLEISRVHPRKKRRLKFLAKNRRDLIEKLEETGLIYACYNY